MMEKVFYCVHFSCDVTHFFGCFYSVKRESCPKRVRELKEKQLPSAVVPQLLSTGNVTRQCKGKGTASVSQHSHNQLKLHRIGKLQLLNCGQYTP